MQNSKHLSAIRCGALQGRVRFVKINRFIKTIFSVTGIVVIGKIIGFVRQILTASTFGATIETDLISLSEGFIGNAEYVIVQTLVTAFVSVYIHAKSKGESACQSLVSDTLKTFLTLGIGMAAVIGLLSSGISKIIAPSYSDALSTQLARYLRIYAPVLILYVLIAIFQAVLNANEVFWPGQMIGINQSVIIIALIFSFKDILGINTLVLGVFAYTIFNTAFLGFLSRNYWRIKAGNPLYNDDIKTLLKMMGPLLLGYSMNFINQQVDKIIVSNMEAGTMTALGYGAVLSNLVTTLIGTICMVLYTRLTTNIAQGSEEKAAALALQSGRIMITVFLPISILTVACSDEIASIVFGHGAFHQTAVTNTARALQGYGCCFIPFVLKSLFSRFQYGRQDTKAPMLNNTIAIACNILFSIIFSKYWGVMGVALATSVSVLICGCLDAASAKRHNQYLKLKQLLDCFPLWLIGGGGCVVIAICGNSWLAEMSAFYRFIIIVLCCGCLYGLVTVPFIRGKFLKKDSSR